MHPILLKLGPLTIHTYGFCIALGFIMSLLYISHEAKYQDMNADQIIDLCFYMLIVGLIGARLFYVVTEWESFQSDVLEIIKIWNGGLVFYGGFLSALVVCFIYVKKYSLPFFKTLDILAPALCIAHAFGRVGCFMAGCCYGKQCALPWAVTFTHPQTLALPHTPLHPVQLYSSIFNLLLFLCLAFLIRRKNQDGWIFTSYLFLYGVGRSCLELFRGDSRGDFTFDLLSPAQTIGLIMIFCSIFLTIVLRSLPKKQPTAHVRKKNHKP